MSLESDLNVSNKRSLTEIFNYCKNKNKNNALINDPYVDIFNENDDYCTSYKKEDDGRWTMLLNKSTNECLDRLGLALKKDLDDLKDENNSMFIIILFIKHYKKIILKKIII